MIAINNNREDGTFRTAILTPYLTDTFDDLRKDYSEEEIKKQVEKYGFDFNNLSEIRRLKAGNLDVLLETAENHSLPHPAMADLVIAGSTEKTEADICAMTILNPRLIVARYSIFYAGPSEYTFRLPEESGYSLDLPKKVGVVKSLLTNEDALRAILSKNPFNIRTAISKLNPNLEAPILITPYLERALRN